MNTATANERQFTYVLPTTKKFGRMTLASGYKLSD